MSKHISKNLEWDDVIPMATVAYNFFPHTPSRERPFLLMFGRDPLTGLQQLLGETTRYLGRDNNKLDLTALQNTYQLVTQNIQMARKRSEVDELPAIQAFQPGELVTLRDHTAKAFDPKYKGEYQIIKYLGKTQVLLRNSKGEEAKHHVAYLKKTDFIKFRRAVKLQLNPDKVPDLKWEYEVAQPTKTDEKDECLSTQIIIKALIFHLCFRFIRSTRGQKNLKSIIRCYKCVQCLHKACTNNVSS